jgi:DNA polymerase-1
VVTLDHQLVTSEAQWAEVVSYLRTKDRVAVDTETTGLKPFCGDEIVGVSVGVPGEAWYCPVHHRRGRNIVGGLDTFSALMTDPGVVKVFHNADFDMRFLLAATGHVAENVDCTLVMASTHDCRRLSHLYPVTGSRTDGGALSLDKLGMEVCGYGKGEAEDRLKAWCREHGPDILGMTDNRKISGFRRAKGSWKTVIGWAPLDLVTAYACMDVDLPMRIFDALESTTPRVYWDIERPLIPALVRMEAVPKYLDLEYIAEMEERTQLWEDAASLACGGVNPRSGKQLIEALFSKEGAFLPVKKFTASGLPSTNADVLRKLQGKHPLPYPALEAKVARKLRTTYLKALRKASDDEGLIYPQYVQWTTATSRLSSRNPNFQNIPRGEFIRRAISAPQGYVRCQIDYSQIEPRLMAHFGKDAHLVHGFRKGVDIYSVMACRIFPELSGKSPDVVPDKYPNLRKVAKVAVLAVCYGAQARKLRTGRADVPRVVLSHVDVSYSKGVSDGDDERSGVPKEVWV